jgi:peptidoglycan/LPS O-acetylase OafA/YrhL
MLMSWVPLAAAFLILLWLRPVPVPVTQDWARWIGLEVLPLVPLVMIVSYCSQGLGGYLGRFAECPPLAALGRISYGVYLFHAIVLALIVKAQPFIPINVSQQGFGRLLIAGAGTLMLASISWLVLEKRINALKDFFPYVAPKEHTTAQAPYGTKAPGIPAYPYRAIDDSDALPNPQSSTN